MATKRQRGPVRYLGVSEFAERVGLKVATIKSYGPKGLLPEPDAVIADVRGWLPSTIDAWQASRPGSPGRPRQSD